MPGDQITRRYESNYAQEIQTSLEYLSSDAAANSIAINCYWPKWNSPWWHMAALFEMGLIKQVPKALVQRMVAAVKRQIPLFFTAEIPPGRDASLESPCHCSLGNIYQILSAAGVDVDTELPWARSWFLRYQMPDGGLNCDEDAYGAKPPASSIVGTIAALEAILLYTPRDFTPDEIEFLDRGAQCLIGRELRLGCTSPHNAEEQEDEPQWLQPCFPRFYFYDTLRGLHFILNWSDKRRQPLSAKAISYVVNNLTEKFPDGSVRIERRAYEGIGTRTQNSEGQWHRIPMAPTFSLLDKISQVGTVSPFLTAHWNKSKALLQQLTNEGLII